jgi:hypothetical protein
MMAEDAPQAEIPPRLRIVCGIDCGLGGALAFLAGPGSGIHDMPTFEIRRGKTKRRDLDGHALHRLLEEMRPAHAFVEQAQAMPRQSAYSTGIFFQCYGEVRGILIRAPGSALSVFQQRKTARALEHHSFCRIWRSDGP